MTIRFDPSGPYEVEERDVPFARPAGMELQARIYRPKGEPAAPLAALVAVHGGAWTRFDRTIGVLHGRGLAACGLVVISLDFRQGPDHQHPAGSADVAAGVRWARANARELQIDAGRIGLTGHSSGGHLALLVSVKPGAEEHAGVPILLPDGSLDGGHHDDRVAFVLALYPVTDPIARYRYVLGRQGEPPSPSGFDAQRLINSHHGYFKDEAAMTDASVTRVVGAGLARALPPVWLAQPELDDNVPAEITDAFVRAYEKAGGRLERERFPGARHGFIGRAGVDTDRCIGLMRDFIGRELGRAKM